MSALATSRPAHGRPGAWGVALFVGGLVAVALALTAAQLAEVLPPALWWDAALHPSPEDAAALVFHASSLPRFAVAALAGAGLALSGGITQAVLGNPLAVPGTLGVTAGAQLAILVAGLAVPALSGLPRETAALVGGFGAFGVVLVTSAAGRFSTLAIVLAGLSVSLFCAALGGVLKLFNHEYLGAVVLWGAGSLVQDDWSVAEALAPRLVVLAALAALLVRPIAVASALSEASARGLGLPLPLVRAAALGIAVACASSVAAAVGVVGFVDLAAPLIVRLIGARRLGPQLACASIAGAARSW